MRLLKTQLLLFIVPVIAAAILLSSIFSFYASADLIKAQKFEGMETLAKTTSTYLEEILNDEERLASAIAMQTQFIDLLETQQRFPGNDTLLRAANVRLSATRDMLDGKENEILLIDRNGRVAATTDIDFIGEDKSNDPLFTNARTGSFIKDAYLDEKNRQLMSASAPIVNESGEFLGVLAIRIPIERLENSIHQIGKVGQTGEVIVYNSKGYAITSVKRRQNTFLKLRPTNENLDACLREGNTTREIPLVYNFKDYSGVDVIGTHSHIDLMGWCVVVKTDLSEALAPLNKMKNRIAAFAILLIIFSLTVMNILSTSITNPINKLTQEVDSITRGNLDTKLERSRIKEIQRLTESLNRILSSLKLAILRKGITQEEIGLGAAIESKEKAERALAENIKQLETVYSMVGDGIILIDTKNENIIKANKAACDMFGYKQTEMIGKKHADLHPKIGAGAPHKGFKELVTGKATRLYEFPFMRKDKTRFYADITAQSVEYEQKPAIVISFRDFTKRKKTLESPEKEKRPPKRKKRLSSSKPA